MARRAPGVPRELDLICRKCLEKNPADRYPEAGALADDLERFLRGEAIRGPRTGVWYAARRTARRWWRPAAALAALVAAVLVAWVLPSPLEHSQRPKEAGEPPKAEAPREEDPLVRLRREEVARRVEALRLTTPRPDRDWPHPLTPLPELPAANFDSFKVLADERIVDMREWRPNPANDPKVPSFVIYQNKRDLIKVGPANELRVETRTSGGEAVMRGMQPDASKVRAFAAQKPVLVGNQAMKVRQLVFGVSDVPPDTDFTLQYTTTYRNSVQRPDEQWFGVIGYEGSFKTSMLMLFPPDRPFRDYQLRVAAAQGRPPEPYVGPVITFAAPDRSWVYWEIPSPKANSVYRIDWNW